MFYSSPYPLEKGTRESAGYDLVCSKKAIIYPGGSAIISTDTKVVLPPCTFGAVTLRSGHGFKKDLFCHIGIIDGDYRGEIKVKVFNPGVKSVVIKEGEKFAQLVILPTAYYSPCKVEEVFEDTERGNKGFGSTGVMA